MAKRAPVDEKPFRPLDVSVLNAVVQHTPEARGGTNAAWPEPPHKIIDLPDRSAPARVAAPLETPSPQMAVPVVQRLDQEKRILYTREETQALDRLVNNLAVRLRTQVKVSHVLRALTALLFNAETQIDQRAGERGMLVRPANGDFAALQRFEREIAGILAHAIRDAGPPRISD